MIQATIKKMEVWLEKIANLNCLLWLVAGVVAGGWFVVTRIL